jgi:hypothetical protein
LFHFLKEVVVQTLSGALTIVVVALVKLLYKVACQELAASKTLDRVIDLAQ